MALRQADVLERAREAQTVHQAEQERHQRRNPPRQRVAVAQGFAGDQHDRQRDRGFDRRRAQRDPAAHAAGQRQAVRQRERADGADQPAPKADQEQQAGHEQQVVEPAQDVLDAQDRVGARDLAAAAMVVGRAIQLRGRLGAGERIDAGLPVEPEDLDQRRRVALADTVHGQRAFQPGASAAHGVRPAEAAVGPARHQVVARDRQSLQVLLSPGRCPWGACHCPPTIARKTRLAKSRAPPSPPWSSRARARARRPAARARPRTRPGQLHESTNH